MIGYPDHEYFGLVEPTHSHHLQSFPSHVVPEAVVCPKLST